MLMTLIQKEILHHILSARFVVLLLMCILLIPLNFYINYRNYLQRQIDYQEAVKLANLEENSVNPTETLAPELEVSKLFLKPAPLSVFANGLEAAMPGYLGMTRNGVREGPPALFSAPLSYLLGNLDFLFLVGTVFSLLALLFTYDAVAGEREAGTLRITLANALPRDLFLWSKLIGGYLVFATPFLVSFLLGLLLLVWQGFPLGEPDIFPQVLTVALVSLIYIAIFFSMGVVISTHLDTTKTALILAFSVWVFAVLIVPRVGFLAAKIVAPTRTSQSVYMEKNTIQSDFRAELKQEEKKIHSQSKYMREYDIGTNEIGQRMTVMIPTEEASELIKKLEEEYRLKFQDLAHKLDLNYQRETARQEQIGETLSRISPTSSLIYLITNLTQTGKAKRSSYFQTADRYYDTLNTDLFSKISNFGIRHHHEDIVLEEPPELVDVSLGETLGNSAVDVLLLCFFVVVLTTWAFLKFFRTDI